MSVYLCRWPNGDISLVSGSNRLAIDEVLDEVGNPDGAEMVRIKHAVAVHFRLKQEISSHDTITECLEFEGFDDRSYWEVCSAYPRLHEVLRKEEAIAEEVVAAVEHEKNRVEVKPISLPDDPTEAMIQLQMNMPKRLAEHYRDVAKANARRRR